MAVKRGRGRAEWARWGPETWQGKALKRGGEGWSVGGVGGGAVGAVGAVGAGMRWSPLKHLKEGSQWP